MADGNVHVIPDTAAWKAKLEEAKAAGKIIIVDFTATWCGPCRMIAPIFAQLSEVFSTLIFVKVDVDELQEVAQEWGVSAMPMFISIKDGNKVGEVLGANPPGLQQLCLEASDMMRQT